MTWTTHTLAELPALLSRLDPDPAFAKPILAELRAQRTAELPLPCVVEFRALEGAWGCPAIHLAWSIPDRCDIRVKFQPPTHLEGCYLRVDMHLEHYFVNVIAHLGPALEQVRRVVTSFFGMTPDLERL